LASQNTLAWIQTSIPQSSTFRFDSPKAERDKLGLYVVRQNSELTLLRPATTDAAAASEKSASRFGREHGKPERFQSSAFHRILTPRHALILEFDPRKKATRSGGSFGLLVSARSEWFISRSLPAATVAVGQIELSNFLLANLPTW